MVRQHTENLVRRFKGQVVTIKTISGGVYQGRITEVTNDYVCLTERPTHEASPVFVFFVAIESLVATEVTGG